MLKKNGGIYENYFKRPLDIVCALIALIVLLPILLLISLFVRIKLGSPILFCQERPGKKEKIFRLYKFRTMTDAKDRDGKLLSDEERTTSFGKKLRATSLDELPELINVLKGDLSIVGPRPLLPSYLPFYSPKERLRHTVRPGLTGYAQVQGRNTLSWEEKFDLDVRYVENITFLGDVKIMLKTIITVIKRDGIELEFEDFDVYRKKQERKEG